MSEAGVPVFLSVNPVISVLLYSIATTLAPRYAAPTSWSLHRCYQRPVE